MLTPELNLLTIIFLLNHIISLVPKKDDRLNSSDLAAWIWKDNAFFGMKERIQAAKSCDQALKLNLEYPNAWCNRASV